MFTLVLLSHSSHLSPYFTVPPKLSPVNPERTLNVGERASLICSVTKGDIPLTIKWLKDGRYLDSSAALSITHVDQFNSMLVIDSVSARHSGNYSCTVRNMAAEETQIQRLIVNGKRSMSCRNINSTIIPNIYTLKYFHLHHIYSLLYFHYFDFNLIR
uniref:Down syndrome cell adhesion molecule homolog n=1 Tax=Cacopsylla melanoneura TaxID=428564 RepID=A0A8D8Y6J4_9HEMI